MATSSNRDHGDMDAFANVAALVAGDEFAKAMTDRNKRRVTAGLSAVGATAGAAGLALGGHNLARSYKVARYAQKPLYEASHFKPPLSPAEHAMRQDRFGKPRRRAAKTALGKEKLATALIPLEVAGLGGEVSATKILHGDTKKKKQPVMKMEPAQSDVHIPGSPGQLKRIAYKQAYKHGKKAAPKAKQVVQDGYSTGKGKLCAIQKSADVVWEGEFSKVDTDKRQVFGWASIVEVNGEPVVDLQGDYIDIDEVEKSAYDYVVKSRKGGDMHRRDGEVPMHVSDMIESFIVTPEKREKMGLPESVPSGWWVGYQINDDEAWNLVKSGKRTGFSIHGRGMRTPDVV